MEEAMYFENYDLESVITPVKVDILEQFLRETKYDIKKTNKLISGFRHGIQH